MQQNELMHHGILGMHWGIRRFQPYPSGYTGPGKFIGTVAKHTTAAVRGYETVSAGNTIRGVSKKATGAISRAVKPPTAEEVVNSGNARLILAYQSQLTTDQLREAYNRANTLQSLERLAPKTISSGEKAFNSAKKVAAAASTTGKVLVKTAKGVGTAANTMQRADKEVNRLDYLLNQGGLEKEQQIKVAINKGDIGFLQRSDIVSHISPQQMKDAINNHNAVTKYNKDKAEAEKMSRAERDRLNLFSVKSTEKMHVKIKTQGKN